MKENHIEILFSNETKQIEESTQALSALSLLIDSEKVKNNYSLVYELLNKYRKINIELTEALIFWNNSEKLIK